MPGRTGSSSCSRSFRHRLALAGWSRWHIRHRPMAWQRQRGMAQPKTKARRCSRPKMRPKTKPRARQRPKMIELRTRRKPKPSSKQMKPRWRHSMRRSRRRWRRWKKPKRSSSSRKPRKRPRKMTQRAKPSSMVQLKRLGQKTKTRRSEPQRTMERHSRWRLDLAIPRARAPASTGTAKDRWVHHRSGACCWHRASCIGRPRWSHCPR